MNNPHRLLLVAALITTEILCAQTAPTGGPRRGGPGGPGGPGGHGRFHPVIRVLDADKDGEISAAEIANAPVSLKALDANSDGTVAADELRPVHPAMRGTPPADAPARPARDGQAPTDRPRPIDPVMLALDANSDGALSATEITNAATSLKALDANADGKLTRDELRPLPPVE